MPKQLPRRSRTWIAVATASVTLGLSASTPPATAMLPPGESVQASGDQPSAVASGGTNAESSWRTVFYDGFSGSSLDSNKWGKYTGGQRKGENAFVSDGKLVLRTKRTSSGWSSAGVSNARALKQTYGRYTIRARMDKGWGVRAVALLWPAAPVWPPEVNFYELNANDASRTKNNLTNHYPPGNQMTHASVKGNFTEWHTMAVWWSPGLLEYRLDGRTVARMTNHVPNQPMWLGLQSKVGGMSASPTYSTPSQVDFEIDWVQIESNLAF